MFRQDRDSSLMATNFLGKYLNPSILGFLECQFQRMAIRLRNFCARRIGVPINRLPLLPYQNEIRFFLKHEWNPYFPVRPVQSFAPVGWFRNQNEYRPGRPLWQILFPNDAVRNGSPRSTSFRSSRYFNPANPMNFSPPLSSHGESSKAVFFIITDYIFNNTTLNFFSIDNTSITGMTTHFRIQIHLVRRFYVT